MRAPTARPGEFYQLDIEMSFVTQEDVFEAVEPVLRGVFEEFGEGKPVTPKFPKIAFRDAIRQYGTDKPDLRNPIVMQNVTQAFRGLGLQGVRQHDRRRSRRSKCGPSRRRRAVARAPSATA